jgi:hypothetical protein
MDIPAGRSVLIWAKTPNATVRGPLFHPRCGWNYTSQLSCREGGCQLRVDNHVEVEGWIDHTAIQDLIYRYSDAVTRADWDQCEVLFAPEAVRESPALDMMYESARSFPGHAPPDLLGLGAVDPDPVRSGDSPPRV